MSLYRPLKRELSYLSIILPGSLSLRCPSRGSGWDSWSDTQETRCQAKAGPMGLVRRKQPPSGSDHLFRTCPTGGTTGVQLPGVLIPHTGRGNTDKGVGSPHTTRGLPIAEEPMLNGSCGDFQFALLPWGRPGEDPVPRQNLGGEAELS